MIETMRGHARSTAACGVATVALLLAVWAASPLWSGGAAPAAARTPGRSPAAPVAVSAGTTMPLAVPLVQPVDADSGVPGLPVAALAGEPPVHLDIPAIAVDAELGRVGLTAPGTIAVPADWQQPAWFVESAMPGAVGPAVIVGHLDSRVGPAVFWRLGSLRVGDAVVVTRRDGDVLRFRVTRVTAFDRSHFPTAEVYGPAAAPVLRLITCAGVFDRSSGVYSQNVVVFAVQA